MSLYEVPYKLPCIVKKGHALDILKCMMILNFVKAVSIITKLPFDIIELIGKKIHEINISTIILERHSFNCGYTDIKEYLCYYKLIKLHISTLDKYESTFNPVILQAAGFWGASPEAHMFIVNLEEQVKIINSHYYRRFMYEGPLVSEFLEFLKKTDIFYILYHTRKVLTTERYFNDNLGIISDMGILEKEIQKLKDAQKRQSDNKKNYNFFDSEEEFGNDIVAICNDMNEYRKKNDDYSLQFLKEDDIKTVGKSSLHLVSGDGFYFQINLCLFDNGDYYFVKIKNQEVICKTDIVEGTESRAPEMCMLINFIELHIAMNIQVPSDINLKSLTSIFWTIYSKIMKQDKSKEENEKEFIDIWSTGKLTIWKSEPEPEPEPEQELELELQL